MSIKMTLFVFYLLKMRESITFEKKFNELNSEKQKIINNLDLLQKDLSGALMDSDTKKYNEISFKIDEEREKGKLLCEKEKYFKDKRKEFTEFMDKTDTIDNSNIENDAVYQILKNSQDPRDIENLKLLKERKLPLEEYLMYLDNNKIEPEYSEMMMYLLKEKLADDEKLSFDDLDNQGKENIVLSVISEIIQDGIEININCDKDGNLLTPFTKENIIVYIANKINVSDDDKNTLIEYIKTLFDSDIQIDKAGKYEIKFLYDKDCKEGTVIVNIIGKQDSTTAQENNTEESIEKTETSQKIKNILFEIGTLLEKILGCQNTTDDSLKNKENPQEIKNEYRDLLNNIELCNKKLNEFREDRAALTVDNETFCNIINIGKDHFKQESIENESSMIQTNITEAIQKIDESNDELASLEKRLQELLTKHFDLLLVCPSDKMSSTKLLADILKNNPEITSKKTLKIIVEKNPGLEKNENTLNALLSLIED